MTAATFSATNASFMDQINEFTNSSEGRQSLAQGILEGVMAYKDQIQPSTLDDIKKELHKYQAGDISIEELNDRIVVQLKKIPAVQTKTSFWNKVKTGFKWGAGIAAIGGIGYLIYNRVKSGDVEGLAEQTTEAANAAASFFQ